MNMNIENKIKNLSCECLELYNKGFVRGAWHCNESQEKWYKNNGEINRLKQIAADNSINTMKKSVESQKTDCALALEEKTKIKEANVMSATHKRWLKRTEKQCEGFLSSRY